MNHPTTRLFAAISIIALLALGAPAADDYEPHPDTVRKEGVPAGEVLGPFQWNSQIYPGTVRDYHLYIPAQYAALPEDKAACVFVIQDGLNRAKDWRLPETFDNLIAEGSMPVTIGIFVDHGVVPPASENAQPRFNRSFEYDSLGDRYVNFLLEEILPEVSKKYRLSEDPNDRAIGGASSGAIAAFNAAWERPDQFRRVLSTIGTYVGLRGADEMATLVRKTEPKPLRVFLQDGENDLDIYAGDWWNANQGMLSALQYAGYEVNHVWGDGGHNGKHAQAIMPDALRWLWKDYPKPITAAHNDRGRINILLEGEGWESVEVKGVDWTAEPLYWTSVATNRAGDIFAAEGKPDIDNNIQSIARVTGDGQASKFADGEWYLELSFDAGERLLAITNNSGLKVLQGPGREQVIANLNAEAMLPTPQGTYVSVSNREFWLVEADGPNQTLNVGKGNQVIGSHFSLAAMTSSPDRSFLIVSDPRSRFTYSFAIARDGKISAGQEYGYLHMPYGETGSGVTAMASDHDGNIYVANPLGIQVMDQLGRVNLIINPPNPTETIVDFCFGGPDSKTLVCTTGDAIYTRRVAATGFRPWDEAVKPPKPGL